MKKSIVGVLLILFVVSPIFASFFKDHGQGWHWYEVQESGTGNQESGEEQFKETFRDPAEVVALYKKELENRLAKAWLQPTSKNIQAYLEMQKDMLDRSENFSEVWIRTVYTNPNLDHTLIAPVNQKARHVHLDYQKEKIKQTIQGLSKEYGLFFFFSSGCSYCHEFAPIVKQFSSIHGWEVLAISADGKGLEEFPEAVSDNGLMNAWNVTVLPSLFAVNPNSGHVMPIAFGLTSIDQMEERIMRFVEEFKK